MKVQVLASQQETKEATAWGGQQPCRGSAGLQKGSYKVSLSLLSWLDSAKETQVMGYYCVLPYQTGSWPGSVSRLHLWVERPHQASRMEGTQGEEEGDELFISDLFSISIPPRCLFDD